MFCPNCGTKNDDTARFCPGCGFRLEACIPPARTRVDDLPSFLSGIFWPAVVPWGLAVIGGLAATWAGNDFFSTLCDLFESGIYLVFAFAIKDGLESIGSAAARLAKLSAVFNTILFLCMFPLAMIMLSVYGDGLDIEDADDIAAGAMFLLFILLVPVAIASVVVDILFGKALVRHHSGNVVFFAFSLIAQSFWGLLSAVLLACGVNDKGLSFIGLFFWLPLAASLKNLFENGNPGTSR